MVLTKRSLFDSATAYAQGGIAAALGAGDSPELHRRDTLAAGAALCDAEAVEVLVKEGPARVRELQTAGAHFDLEPGGDFKLGREAAHSRRRIVHAHGDQTGAEVARALIERVSDNPKIQVLEKTRVLDLITAGRCVYGVRATVAGTPTEIIADATVLATGGCGQVYRYTTNPQVATGDGYAIAHRAGVRLADMEFVQFHPTALETPENPLALISEAVRGEGAVLINDDGERFMLKRHRLAELAPRDVVAREIFRERALGSRVWLDARKLGASFRKRFPGIFAICQARGINPAKDLIPVIPAAHYMMGGIVTDLSGRSTFEALYACGEVSRTGVHGANRLASNSLLEAVVFAARIAEDIGGLVPEPKTLAWDGAHKKTAAFHPEMRAEEMQLRQLMSANVGVIRSGAGLARALGEIIACEAKAKSAELKDMATTALMIAAAAYARTESRGAHYRSDFPEPDPAQAKRSYFTLDETRMIANRASAKAA